MIIDKLLRPLTKLLSVDERVKDLAEEKSFKQFQRGIESKFDLKYRRIPYPRSFLEYISSLFLVDMMDEAFTEKEITLPHDLKVLDVGAGKWPYAPLLYHFLKNYNNHGKNNGKRNVYLTGIDILGLKHQRKVQKLIQDIPVKYIADDVFNLNGKEKYDLIFMAHMLSKPEHFREFNIGFRPSPQLFEKLFGILKPEGILVGIAYDMPEDADIFDDFPENKKIYSDHYNKDFGPITNFLHNHYKFNENLMVLARNN